MHTTVIHTTVHGVGGILGVVAAARMGKTRYVVPPQAGFLLSLSLTKVIIQADPTPKINLRNL
jgi:hypothetical protein